MSSPVSPDVHLVYMYVDSRRDLTSYILHIVNVRGSSEHAHPLHMNDSLAHVQHTNSHSILPASRPQNKEQRIMTHSRKVQGPGCRPSEEERGRSVRSNSL